MKILLHGGNCCGIKHICSLGSWPKHGVAAREIKIKTSIDQTFSPATNDMRSRPGIKYRNEDFFNGKAPEETYEARFERFVKYIKEKRPHGVIEVVINNAQKAWIPIFESHGFKEVSKVKNSNTAGTITVYHLTY